MDASTPEKLVIIATHGPEDPEMATIPFVMAAAARASDVDVVMAFQSKGVNLVRRGEPEHVMAAGFAPLRELLANVQELGVQLLVCSPCLNAREVVPEDLIDGAEVAAAGRLVAEVTSAVATLTY